MAKSKRAPNHRPSDQQLVKTIDNFLHGNVQTPEIEVLSRAINDRESLLRIRDLYPLLRSEDYALIDDKNPWLVLLRVLLWTDERLGNPSKIRRTPLPGFLARFWHDLILPCLEPLPLRPESIHAIVAAYDNGAKAFAELDRLFDPWTGDVPPLQVLKRHRKAAPEVDDKKRQTNLALTFQCVGHTVNMIQKNSHLPLRHEFQRAMKCAAVDVSRSFELLRHESLRAHGEDLSGVPEVSEMTSDKPSTTTDHPNSVASEVEWGSPLRQWLESLPDLDTSRDAALKFVCENGLRRSYDLHDYDEQYRIEYVDDEDDYSEDARDLWEDIEVASVEEDLDSNESVQEGDADAGDTEQVEVRDGALHVQKMARGDRPTADNDEDDGGQKELQTALLKLRDGLDISQGDDFPEPPDFGAEEQPESGESGPCIVDVDSSDSDSDSDSDGSGLEASISKEVDGGVNDFVWGWDSSDAYDNGKPARHSKDVTSASGELESLKEWIEDDDVDYRIEADDGEGEGDSDDGEGEGGMSSTDQIHSSNARLFFRFQEADRWASSTQNAGQKSSRPRKGDKVSSPAEWTTQNVIPPLLAGTLDEQDFIAVDDYHDILEALDALKTETQARSRPRDPSEDNKDKDIVRVQCPRQQCQAQYDDPDPAYSPDGRYLKWLKTCQSCRKRAYHPPVDGRLSVCRNKVMDKVKAK